MINEKFDSYTKHSRQALVQQMLECAIVCEECASSCLNEKDVTALIRCIELNRDCADTCLQLAKLVARNSEITNTLLMACEEICRLCAAECNKHAMEHCQQCADLCNQCADACHEHNTKLQLIIT
jgi:hypothetical protein